MVFDQPENMQFPFFLQFRFSGFEHFAEVIANQFQTRGEIVGTCRQRLFEGFGVTVGDMASRKG